MSVKFLNWGRNVSFSPVKKELPNNEEELCALVKNAYDQGRKIRCVGTGHSFTPICHTNDILVSLDNMQGLVNVEGERATVWAGTKLKALGVILHQQGLAQVNLGDIDVQSIAGAISTGTHGTGVTLGSVATQIVGFRMVNGKGEVVVANEKENTDLLKGGIVSIGMMGIITQVTVQCCKKYTLQLDWYPQSLNKVLADLENMVTDNRNFEFFSFPHTQQVMVKTMNLTEEKPRKKSWFHHFNELVMENYAFSFVMNIARWFPSLKKSVARLIASFVSTGQDVMQSHETFASIRDVRFVEMEYNVPYEHFSAALQEVLAMISDDDMNVIFPIECRFVAGDDLWMAPTYGRKSAYIAVHQLTGMPYEEYFEKCEKIFAKYQGRPHWGKCHNLTLDDVKRLYPKYDDFMKLRASMDPKQVFVNEYLSKYITTDV